MFNKLLVITAGILGCSFGLVAADKKPDITKLPAPAAKSGLTWDNDIKPLTEKSCVKCHGSEKPKSKYRVDSKESFIKGGESGDQAVVAGKSAESPVVLYVADLVEDMEMPPTDKRDKYPSLTREQIALLRAWIDQGAK
jgi:Planctomycete cytochrome C